jgi:NAD(P)-dependent dehydrogenase (short-subunit alcohol dehydrogenase family)
MVLPHSERRGYGGRVGRLEGAAVALVARTVGELGALDILVNNSGTTRDRTFHNLDDELWDLVLDTNVRTAFHATLAAVGHMRESAKRETAERGTPGHHGNVFLASSEADYVTGAILPVTGGQLGT